MFEIIGVKPNSIGEELDIKAGDKLVSFDDIPIQDILDYIYYDGQEEFSMCIESGDELIDFDIEKEDGETLGLLFADNAGIKTKTCHNKCLFCFVDQLPKGMRNTLYVKDDDYRLSFISGNYVTLTNLSEDDIERIVRLGLSPLYISVHATDTDARRKLLHNKNAEIMSKLKKLDSAGIKLDCQIVLCPEINDGEVLQRTLSDLYSLKNVETVAIVPLGLTKYNKNNLTPVDKTRAREVIKIVEEFNKKHKTKTENDYFAYCSDEFYIKAELPVLPYEAYGNFAQIENGVGLIAKFEKDCDEVIRQAEKAKIKPKKVSIATGMSAYSCIKRMTNAISLLYNEIEIQVYPIINNFFGESITVTGLLTAGDIKDQLQTKDLGETLLLSRTVLREFGTQFLDGVTLEELSEKLGVKIRAISPDGYNFAQTLLY